MFTGIYAFVVLKDGVTQTEDELVKDLRNNVKKRIASFAQPDFFLVCTFLVFCKGKLGEQIKEENYKALNN